MKICIIASGDFFSAYGGGQKYVKNLVEHLAKHSHEITVLNILNEPNLTGLKKETLSSNKYQVINILKGQVGYDKNAAELNIEFQDFLKNILLEIKPQIVHANGYKYAFSKICYDLNISCIITAHHGGLVCPAGALLNDKNEICKIKAESRSCLSCCLQWNKPLSKLQFLLKIFPQDIYIAIGNQLKQRRLIPYITPFLNTPLNIQHKLQEISTLIKYTQKIIAPSKAIETALITNGVDPKKITLIPHGVEDFLSNQKLNSDSIIHMAFIGRIHHIKGLHILMKSLLRLKNYHLHIFGEAITKIEQRYKESLLNEYQNVNCTWHGKLTKIELEVELQNVQLVILPSICMEIFGLVVAEAFAMKIPVIATRCGGPEDQIQNGINGFLVEPNNSIELQKKLQEITESPSVLTLLKSNINPPFSFNDHILKIEETYEQAFKEGVQNVY